MKEKGSLKRKKRNWKNRRIQHSSEGREIVGKRVSYKKGMMPKIHLSRPRGGNQ